MRQVREVLDDDGGSSVLLLGIDGLAGGFDRGLIRPPGLRKW
jgi:hypothetical protein